MPQLETVAVVCYWGQSRDRVLINRSDFDPSLHTLWENRNEITEAPHELVPEIVPEPEIPDYMLNEDGMVEVRDTQRRGRPVMVEISETEWLNATDGRFVLWSLET